MRKIGACPECGSEELFRSRPVSSGGGHAPNYLAGLGGVLVSAKFTIVVCRRCGLTRFFAAPAATAKLSDSSKWTRLR